MTVYLQGTVTKPTLYSDDGVTTTANPVTGDTQGNYFFYIEDGRYDIVHSGGSPAVTPYTISNIEIWDASEKPTEMAHMKQGADAGVKISAAITALPSTGGTVDARGFEGAQTISTDIFSGVTKPVTLLLGTATYTASVTQNPSASKLEISGLGDATIIKPSAATFNLFKVGGSATDVVLHDLRLEGVTTTETNDVALLNTDAASPPSRLRISRVHFTSADPSTAFYMRGIYLNGVNDSWVEDCIFDAPITQNGVSFRGETANATGILLSASSRNHCVNNKFNYPTTGGVNLIAVRNGSNDNIITKNTFVGGKSNPGTSSGTGGGAQVSIFSTGAGGVTNTNNSVVDNMFRDYNGSAVGTVDTNGTAVTWVSGNTFRTYWTSDIRINGVDYTILAVGSSTSLTLTGTAGVQTGVAYATWKNVGDFVQSAIQLGANTVNTTVALNRIRNTTGIGISALDDSTDNTNQINTISGNNINSTTKEGILVSGTLATLVEGNLVQGAGTQPADGLSYAGIKVGSDPSALAADRVKVIGNAVYASAAAYGIWIRADVSPPSLTQLIGNVVRPGVTASFFDGGSSTYWSGNSDQTAFARFNSILIEAPDSESRLNFRNSAGTNKLFIATEGSIGALVPGTAVGDTAIRAYQPIYISADGGATAEAKISNSGLQLNAGQFINTVATGTAPLSITSTTPVANLSLSGGTGTSVVTDSFQLTKVDLTLVNGDNNDIALSGKSFNRIVGPTGVFAVTGFAGGANGRILYLYNGVLQTMTIKNQNAGSAVGNKILTLTGGDVVLRAGARSFATFIYDASGGSTIWILVATN